MAHDNETTSGITHDIGLDKLGYALALLAGSGVVLMILALALGVIDTAVPAQTGGEPATGSAQAVMFGLGLLAMVIGGAVWFFYVRPDTHFDDIDVPLDAVAHSHHDDAHHPDQTDQTALLPAETHTPDTAAHSH